MKCNKCHSYKCRCKKVSLTTESLPCNTPKCKPRKRCLETISWNCVSIGDAGILLQDGTDTLYIKEGTSLSSFWLQYTMFNDITTRPCIMPGGQSMAVKDFDVIWDGNALLVQWEQVNNSNLLSGWTVDEYQIVITDGVNTITTTVSNTSSTVTIPPTAPITYTSGTKIDIYIKTVTQDTSTPPNISTCNTITKRITIP